MSRYRRFAKWKPSEWERLADARSARWWLVAKLLLFLGGVLWVYAVITSAWFQGLFVHKVKAAERTTVTIPGFVVGDEFGAIKEPPMAVVQAISGEKRVTLRSLLADTPEEYRKEEDGTLAPVPPPIEVPVTALKMVQPFAKRTKRGNCCGVFALKTGKKNPRNSVFYRPANVACAAYTAFILRHCGRSGASYSATAQYGQLRRWGGKLVATRMSTSYLPYLKYMQAGDYIYFHKGSRFGHVEVYVGRGLVSGTSSSQGRVAIRRLSKRGFKQCSVVRF